ncbi:MAG TPA: PAS domain S-box protein, partial [Devosia sp.]
MSRSFDGEESQGQSLGTLYSSLSPELKTLVDVVRSAPFPMFVLLGPNRKLIYNEAYEPILGRHHPSAAGRPFFEVWPEVEGNVGHLIENAYAGKASHFEDMKVVLNRPQPQVAWFTFSYSPIRDTNLNVVGVLCVCTETTESVVARQRQGFLINLEEKLRGYNDALSIVKAAQEELGTHFGVSRVGYGSVDETERFFTTEENWTDGSVPSHSGTHDLAGFGEEIFRSLRAGETLDVEDTVTDPRAQDPTSMAAFAALQVRSAATVSLIKNGKFVAALYLHHHQPRQWTKGDLALIEDVAERTWSAVERAKAEADLRRLNETLEAQVAERAAERDRIWNLSQDMLARADFSGMMSAVSPAWTQVLGWGESELLTRGYATFMHPDDLPPTLEAIGRMAETGRPTRFENRIATADGAFKPIEWTVVPEPDGRNFIAVGRDMSAVRAREEELHLAQEALRQAQKMEAVGQLTGGLAHDFNNILAGISGSLQLMSTRLAQGRIAELDRYITAASGASQRAAGLTQRLLAFSRRQTLEPKPTNLNTLVNGMMELVYRSVGPAIEVEAANASGLWTTFVDAGQLENALLNLCINARDAMPDGGKLTIETGNRWMDERGAKQHNMAPGQYVSLCVSDTGTGMAPEVVERAFDPFFTTKPIGQGTGLGLSMVY